jgi:hypothetical protein
VRSTSTGDHYRAGGGGGSIVFWVESLVERLNRGLNRGWCLWESVFATPPCATGTQSPPARRGTGYLEGRGIAGEYAIAYAGGNM